MKLGYIKKYPYLRNLKLYIMGQYYKAAILGKDKKAIKQWMYSWDFNAGSKLTEHSWIESKFVKTFESLIYNNPQRVVWAGDYADECKGRKTNVYSRCGDKTKVEKTNDNIWELSVLDSLFVINHTKKQFINKINVINNNGWRVHPLPLMTCEGNGRGGGDYLGEDEIVGTWARDLISVSDKVPDGFTELKFTCEEKF